MRLLRGVLFVVMMGVAAASGSHELPVLSVKVSPELGFAPLIVTVRVIVRPQVDNYRLQVQLKDGDFDIQSSERSLDGTNADPAYEYRYRLDIPTDYHVVGTLYSREPGKDMRMRARDIARVSVRR